MINVIINPGSGPVNDGNIEQSEINIKAFIEDLGIPQVSYEYIKTLEDGRHLYKIWDAFKTHEIEMPPLPLERVRYLGNEGQNILSFPRLYVDGSSWVWKYALDMCFNEEED